MKTKQEIEERLGELADELGNTPSWCNARREIIWDEMRELREKSRKLKRKEKKE